MTLRFSTLQQTSADAQPRSGVDVAGVVGSAHAGDDQCGFGAGHGIGEDGLAMWRDGMALRWGVRWRRVWQD